MRCPGSKMAADRRATTTVCAPAPRTHCFRHGVDHKMRVDNMMVMVVVAVMVATTQGAFIDNRPKMPR